MRQGAVTVTVLGMMLILLSLSLLTSQIARLQLEQSLLRLKEEQAYYTVKGAMQLPLTDPDGLGQTEKQWSGQVGPGSYSVKIRPLSPDAWEITGQGEVQQQIKRLQAKVRQSQGPLGLKQLEWQWQE